MEHTSEMTSRASKRAQAMHSVSGYPTNPVLARSLLAYVALQPLSTYIRLHGNLMDLTTESRPDYLSGNSTVFFPDGRQRDLGSPCRTYFEVPHSAFSRQEICGFQIRPMKAEDQNAWLECTREALPEGDMEFSAWLQGEYCDLQRTPGMYGVVAEQEGQIVGSLIAGELSAGILAVDEVMVRERFRGLGLCSALLNYTARHLSRGDMNLAMWVDPESNLHRALVKKGVRPLLIGFASSGASGSNPLAEVYLRYCDG